MISVRRTVQDRILELGGGSHPHVNPGCMGGTDVAMDVRMCQNEQGQQCTDIQWDFNNVPLPLKDEEFDGVFSMFAIEHISWRKVKELLAEIRRVLKPGGRLTAILPNTEEQLRWVQNHPEGWDGKDAFESMSCILFGDNDYPENTHRAYFSPLIVTDLLRAAGFDSVTVQSYGERATDVCVQAVKVNSEPPLTSGVVVKPSTEWNQEKCGANGPNGLVCVREKGHDGKHAG